MKTDKQFDVLDKQTGDAWQGEELTATSKTTIQQEEGHGQPVTLQFFTFDARPFKKIWKENPPTKQELFNKEFNGIEKLLWGKGLKPFTDVEPRLIYARDGNHYTIVVACVAQRGVAIKEEPKTLTQVYAGI